MTGNAIEAVIPAVEMAAMSVMTGQNGVMPTSGRRVEINVPILQSTQRLAFNSYDE